MFVPKVVELAWHVGTHRLKMPDDPSSKKRDISENFQSIGQIPCFPLQTLLAAIGVTHVDYFSLDVEGLEFKILKTLPFDQSLSIDVIMKQTINKCT